MHLTDPIKKHFQLSGPLASGLSRVGIETIRDLLFYFPVRYGDASVVRPIADIRAGETATVFGTIRGLKVKKGFRSKIPMGEATIADETGSISVIWFNQPYLAKMITGDTLVKATGKVTAGKHGIYLANPEIEKTSLAPSDVHRSLFKKDGDTEAGERYPVYRETRGVTSRWIYHAIERIFRSGLIAELPEYLPETIIKKYKLPQLQTALVWLHMPKSDNDAVAARKRFAFEEVFFIQLARGIERFAYELNKSYAVHSDKKNIDSFVSRFPFEPTLGQKRAISTILKDIETVKPMARLLEGDVGSGKTAVAATAAYAVITNRPDNKNFGNLQVAYMAPTEILATQHFENFIQYFKHTGISIGLITSSGCKKFPSKVTDGWTSISRPQLLKWVANGEIPILIGTHALIQKSIHFKHLALVIVDEQHRFGALQRAKLAKKDDFAPHYLSMTATPIPRTLALTIYGDLDLTLLDQMPSGRKPIITELVPPNKREETYERIKRELESGRQAYVICPRIDEPDPTEEMALQAKSVTAEAKRLKKEVFRDYSIGILHSKMTKEKKEAVMLDFVDKKIDILIATSVVEVGVSVPNATNIIIEGAERFGLAQLHQLRGRVIRSNHQAYCYLFTDSKSDKMQK